MHITDVIADLHAEHAALDAVVAVLSDDQWDTATPSPGWTVSHQIAHLTYFDHRAADAIADPDTFPDEVTALFEAAMAGNEQLDDMTLGPVLDLAVGDRLDAWRAGRAALDAAARTLGDDDRVAWYGPSMGSKSFLTARLMETWAHGQDVCDAVGATREPTERLRHIAQLGVITRGWSYTNRGLGVPDVEVRVELTSPSDETWTWGPPDAAESVVGPAEDFCLVVTQRRHVDDSALAVTGDAAGEWMRIAQAFAGGATDGPVAKADR
ncbi:MAG TPA: TIGR03084 family metal-binding protein [Acidimicrobiales bacterium]